MSRKLAELLLKERIITPQQFSEAQAAAKTGQSYIRSLIDRQVIAEGKLLFFLSKKFGLTSINLAKFEVNPAVLKLVPSQLARKSNAVPIQTSRGTLVVALCDPTYLPSLEDLKFQTKLNVEAVITTYSAFDAAMSKYYGGVAIAGEAFETFHRDAAKEKGTDQGIELFEVHDIDTGASAEDAPVIAFVNGVLGESVRLGASDIHVEPYEKRFRVRLRIDGVLREITQVPPEMKRAVVARLKIMSRMDIAESRVPQDGRIKLKAAGRDVDFRVNTLPTLFGEKVVMRMLSRGSLQLDLTKLGFESRQLEIFKKGILAPNGMVLVTGPTGSGKTTTLYSALSELNQISDNLSTVEDPVEYNLDGVNQVQIHKEVGLTFANVLRALLRQDPDTILVGEIRDYETAEVAIQAALTGHLVLSTLHTNDAPSTITRLMNMGVEPFLVVASLNSIVAQRLLRTICSKCREERSIPPERLVQAGFSAEMASKVKTYQGKGCATCANTGYKGRIAIYEVLDFSPTLKEMVLKGATALELKKQAMQEGMKTLRMSALTKMTEGFTTLEEALTLTMEN